MLSKFRTLLQGWIRFATLLGNIQIIVVLSLIYWTMVLMVAVPFKLLASPLAMKRSNIRSRWVVCRSRTSGLDWMRRQG